MVEPIESSDIFCLQQLSDKSKNECSYTTLFKVWPNTHKLPVRTTNGIINCGSGYNSSRFRHIESGFELFDAKGMQQYDDSRGLVYAVYRAQSSDGLVYDVNVITGEVTKDHNSTDDNDSTKYIWVLQCEQMLAKAQELHDKSGIDHRHSLTIVCGTLNRTALGGESGVPSSKWISVNENQTPTYKAEEVDYMFYCNNINGVIDVNGSTEDYTDYGGKHNALLANCESVKTTR